MPRHNALLAPPLALAFLAAVAAVATTTATTTTTTTTTTASKTENIVTQIEEYLQHSESWNFHEGRVLPSVSAAHQQRLAVRTLFVAFDNHTEARGESILNAFSFWLNIACLVP